MQIKFQILARQICLALFFLVFHLDVLFAAPAINSWEAIRVAFYPNQTILLSEHEISIQAPEQAEDSAIVPVTISVKLLERTIKRVDVFTDANPILLTASFIPQIKSQFFEVSTRIRLDNSSFLRVIVEDDSGNKRMRAIPIKTPGGGCGGGIDPDEMKLRNESGKMKLKLFAQDKSMVFNIKHPMRTGFERTSMGYYAKAWFIQSIAWQHNGRPFLKAELGPGISADPYFKILIDDALMQAQEHHFYVEARDNEGKVFSQLFEMASTGD
jgi:sulfur-oxidizing protein SoxY